MSDAAFPKSNEAAEGCGVKFWWGEAEGAAFVYSRKQRRFRRKLINLQIPHILDILFYNIEVWESVPK